MKRRVQIPTFIRFLFQIDHFFKKVFKRKERKTRSAKEKTGQHSNRRVQMLTGNQLAYPTGFEPAASRVGVLRSIQLGYG